MGKEDWSNFNRPYYDFGESGGSTTTTYSVEECKQYRELEKMKLEDEKYQKQLLEEFKIGKAIKDAKKEEYKKKRNEENRFKRKKEKLYCLGFNELGFIHPLYQKVIYERTFTEFINVDAKNLYHILKSTDEEYRPFLCKYDNYKNIYVLLYLIPENINLSSDIDDYIISKEDNIKWCDKIKVIFILKTEFLEKSNFWYNIIKNINETNYKESNIFYITKKTSLINLHSRF